jgi:hypothetical protein
MNLRHPIEFLQNIKTNPTDEDRWETCYRSFADISYLHPYNLSLVENSNFGHILTTSLLIATVRWTDNLQLNMRIKFDGKIFEIKKIIEDFDSRKFIKLIILEI